MKRFTVGIMTMALALMVGCSKGTNSVKDTSKPIIKVNNTEITKDSFSKIYDPIYDKAMANAGNEAKNNPQVKLMSLLYKDKVVNDLVIRELITQEAQKRNVQVSDDEVNKAMSEIASKLGGDSKLEATLTLNNINKDDFSKNVKMDLTVKKLIDKISVITANEKDAKAFYDKFKTTRFVHPDLVKAEHILISADENQIKANIQAENSGLKPDQISKKVSEEVNKAKQKAEKLLAQVKANPSKFSEIASKNSEDPSSAQKGGDLGFFSKGDMVPEFSKVAFSTNPGQISNIVKSNFGYHIIKVVDRKKGGVTPYSEVKNEILTFLKDQQKMQTLQKLIEGSKSTAKVVYIDPQYNPKNIQNELRSFAKANKIPMPEAPANPVKK